MLYPTSDRRLYRSLVLSNSLPVLLISDPSTDISSLSLSVRTGHFDDPPDTPGLAHFTEHMMFMGSARYPDESAYFDYVLGHGGMANGYTLAEETNFHLKVESPYLYGAMDRFASVFVQPRLRLQSMEREVQAVDSEFSKNLLVEERRLYQVLAMEALPDHPMHHFSTGNARTLNLTAHMHRQLLRFYHSHYSANVMALVVLGREPLSKAAVRRHAPLLAHTQPPPHCRQSAGSRSPSPLRPRGEPSLADVRQRPIGVPHHHPLLPPPPLHPRPLPPAHQLPPLPPLPRRPRLPRQPVAASRGAAVGQCDDGHGQRAVLGAAAPDGAGVGGGGEEGV